VLDSHSPAPADRVEPAAAHHRPPVPAATRAAPTNQCRRLLLHPHSPAAADRLEPTAAHYRPPVRAATGPARTDKFRRLLSKHR